MGTFTHHDHDIDNLDEEDFWPIVGALSTVLAVWTGVVHLIDFWTFNVMPWWLEPFTISPIIFLIIMKEKFDSLNPTHLSLIHI